MKTIGILGGMSWESTQTYYRLINQGVRDKLGGNHSAEIIINSLDFAPIEKQQAAGQWDDMANVLAQKSKGIEAAGADCLLIATNTMHKLYPQVQSSVNIPVLHIADAIGKKLESESIQKVGLLGTAFTMEQPFYRKWLIDNFNIEVVIPGDEERSLIHRVIYEELCQGKCFAQSKSAYLKIVDQLHDHGAEAVILGCTEIGLLINQSDTQVPLFDTTEAHTAAAVEFALS
ncbi:aspartate/glutamate racemase family protein [Aliikangiella sp. G2MR2-5]|uniref:aspartate/glutamate racemase family protein n=1 Tax=Aliikangiella sp. G2MR2-5 TaxID=2788943 RepID=UPI0018AA2436|nr:aspartate/glutamate racemase family protein [Aliikangiella sp. G2MR2-5]